MTMTEPANPTAAPFVYWPLPSPTSKYNINVRFYRIEDANTGMTTDWDLGEQYEQMLEVLYDALAAESRVSTPRQFEDYVRKLMEARLTFSAGNAAYPALLSLILGDGEVLYEDMVRSTDTTVKLHNKVADLVGQPHQTNPLKRPSLWKKLFS